MIKATWHVHSGEVERMLRQLDQALSPTSFAAWLSGDVTDIFQRRAAARFASQGDDASGKWTALAAATPNFRGGSSQPINVRTGDLSSWLTSSQGVVTAGGSSAQMVWPAPGSDVQETKFAVAQKGRPDNFLNLGPTPPRPVAAINEQDLSLVLISFHRMIFQRMRA